MVLCSNCMFFPNKSEVHDLIREQNIFGLTWKCPFCSHFNLTRTDKDFRFYSNSTATLDIQELPISKTLILIEVCPEMVQEFSRVPSQYYCRSIKIDEISKESMAQSEGLYKTYLEKLGAAERIKRGRGFEWKLFLKSKVISKI